MKNTTTLKIRGKTKFAILYTPPMENLKLWRKHILPNRVISAIVGLIFMYIIHAFFRFDTGLFYFPLWFLPISLLEHHYLMINNKWISGRCCVADNGNNEKYVSRYFRKQIEDMLTWVVERQDNHFQIRINCYDGMIIVFPLYGDMEYVHSLTTALSDWLPMEKEFNLM